MASMAEMPELQIPESPLTVREGSPSPSISPTPALSACPPLERSVSAASSTSTFSQLSTVSRSSDGVVGRRRGYARPQGTCFADSAKNRESVMSLGSIAHVQHYFARTGLLDGKGGQHYHGKLRKKSRPSDADFLEQDQSRSYPGTPPAPDLDSQFASMTSSPDMMLGSVSRAASEDPYTDGLEDLDDPNMMLPPTVSTYNPRPKYVPPPKTPEELRRLLRKSLVEARKSLEETTPRRAGRSSSDDGETDQNSDQPSEPTTEPVDAPSSEAVEAPPLSPGTAHLQGLWVLDTMTGAIREAKNYYTGHEQPARLASFRSERKLREDLLGVMDTLKRMAVRNFAGGVRGKECAVMTDWIRSVEDLLRHEETLEAAERTERLGWAWTKDEDWSAPELQRDREWLFLNSFEPTTTGGSSSTNTDPLPPWTAPSSCPEGGLPTPFLRAMQTGLRLVRLHNEMVRKSRKTFGQITAYHTDTAKPYRCADNLRYWIKAAELRWDICLKVDVMGVVYSRGDDVWTQFDRELLRWCAKVRADIVAEWAEGNEVRKMETEGLVEEEVEQ